MTPGFIYVLSNPCLTGLVKIGLTKLHPEWRTKGLSRSTAIPADFKLEYAVRVTDVQVAETRIHLLLGDKRYSGGKEFFEISLKEAVRTIDAVAAFMKERQGISPEISIHGIEIFSISSQKLSIFDMKILRLLMYATENNSSDMPAGTPPTGIVDGFVDAGEVAWFLRTSEAQAKRHMASFRKNHRDLTKGIDYLAYLMGRSPNREAAVDIDVFDELHYHRGQMAWIFSPHYRGLFNTRGEKERYASK